MAKHVTIKILPTGEMVMKFRVIGTDTWVFQAWSPVETYTSGGCFCHEDGRLWVQIGSDPDSSKYQNLPVGLNRFDAVQAAYNERYAVAQKLIFQAFKDELEILQQDKNFEIVTSGREVEIRYRPPEE